MNRRTTAIVTTVILLLGCATALMAGPGHKAHSRKEIHQKADITTAGTSNIGDATLIRDEDGICIRGTSGGLTPGNAYSFWWIVFDPSGVLVLNATGDVANADGEILFGACLPVGDYGANEINPRRVLFGASLTDPTSATVWNHILDHGPVVPGLLRAQISTVDANCEPFDPATGGGCPLTQEHVYEGE